MIERGAKREPPPNSFGEDTSSREGSRRSTPSSICIRTQAAVQRARDLTLIRSQRRQVERDPRGQPNFPRFVGKLVCPNGQKFETSCLPATHRRLSLLRDFQTFFARREFSTRTNIEIRRNELSREDAGCRHSRDRTGGKLLEIRFSTRRVTLP